MQTKSLLCLIIFIINATVVCSYYKRCLFSLFILPMFSIAPVNGNWTTCTWSTFSSGSCGFDNSSDSGYLNKPGNCADGYYYAYGKYTGSVLANLNACIQCPKNTWLTNAYINTSLKYTSTNIYYNQYQIG